MKEEAPSNEIDAILLFYLWQGAAEDLGAVGDGVHQGLEEHIYLLSFATDMDGGMVYRHAKMPLNGY